MGKSDTYTDCACRLPHVLKERKIQTKSERQRTKETTTGIQRDGIDSKVKAMDKDRDNAEVPMREHMEC